MADNTNNVSMSAANGTVNDVGDENFIPEVIEAGVPVLVDFKAEWCGPCKVMGPVFSALAPEYKERVKFAKLDVDHNPGVAGALQIESIPTFMLIQGNTVYAMGVGAMPADSLRKWIEEGLEHIAHTAAEAAAAPAEA